MALPPAVNDLSRHHRAIEGEIAEALQRVAASGWYVLGREVATFERAFADYCGAPAAVGVANGTDALELALVATGVRAGDRVALAANAGGYGTTAVNAIGGVPVYVDVDAQSATLDPGALERVLREQPVRAVVVTHLYGRMADVEEISRVTAAAGAVLVEDCAQAHGAERAGRRAGAWGDVAAFSFYPTKNLGALGDGGAVLARDPEVAARLRMLRQYGWDGKYRQTHPGGRNSRLDELQAAVLLAKLAHLDGWNARRAAVAARYGERIKHPSVVLPETQPGAYVAHLYVIRADDRDGLAAHLRAHAVPHDIHYPLPDYRQPVFGDRFSQVSLPVTERLCAQVLTLPCFPEMTDEEVDGVADVVNSWSR